ncbi:glycosyltransferase [Lacrimispora sp.]|uniref:glycosyltransferase n=1 Tax=Lacrimispora sp. TaxID=2719234 RepID=UPI0032E47342
MNFSRVCAVVVTYNRVEYLLKLIESLKIQTKKLDAILIFDNNSTDNTNGQLIKLGFANNNMYEKLNIRDNSGIKFMYYRNSFNSGGSGGFYSGMKLASEMEYEYLWCMDDDVLPNEDCLSILLENMSNNVRLCIPTRTDERYKDFAVLSVNMHNPFVYKITSRKRCVYNDDILEDCVEIQDMPFEGPLIANSLVNEIGLPNKDLFIIFDDSEYAYRACKKTKLMYCKKAILHKQIIPNQCENSLMNWKNYYGWRNQFWFDKTYGKNLLVRTLRPFFQTIDLFLRAIVKRKWSNIRVVKKAYIDAINGTLGKVIEPGVQGKDI